MIEPIYKIGPLTIHIYGVIIAAAVYIGWYIARKRGDYYKIPKKIFDDPILLIPLVLGFAAARLYHVIDYWDFYSQNLTSVFYIANGGIGIWGGIVGGFLGFIIVAKLRNLDILKTLDLVAPSVILGQAIGRIGNWVNQEGFGPPSNLPWAVEIDPAKRPPKYSSFSSFHPTFFYEALLDLLIFFVLIYFAKKFKVRGMVFALYLILYSVSRFFIEYLRIDTWTFGTIKIAQVAAFFGLLLGSYLFIFLRKRALT